MPPEESRDRNARDLFDSPLTRPVRDWHRKRVRRAFDLPDDGLAGELLLRRYLDDVPERFYDRSAYEVFLAWLRDRRRTHPSQLEEWFEAEAPRLDIAFHTLREVCSADWHDAALDRDSEYALVLDLIDRVHPAYLRLAEGVLVSMLRVIAVAERQDRKVSSEGLNANQVCEEVKRAGLGILVRSFRRIMRNGIAHGGVTVLLSSIRFTGGKGESEEVECREVIRILDDLLDTCNGLAAALAVFLMTTPSMGCARPRELTLQELQEEAAAPWWKVLGCVESETPDGPQLVLYAEDTSISPSKSHYSAVQTAVLAEELAPGYSRYFVSISSPTSHVGWLDIRGDSLAAIRQSNWSRPELLAAAIPSRLTPGKPLRSRIPLAGKFETLRHSFALHRPLMAAQFRDAVGRPEIKCRFATAHRNSWGAVLDGRVVIHPASEDPREEIWRSRRAILRAVRRAARNHGPNRFAARLPTGFARVSVFTSDYRVRRLRIFGLQPELICTLTLQRIRRIQCPDIIGSTVETRGSWRIAWNRAWLEGTGGGPAAPPREEAMRPGLA